MGEKENEVFLRKPLLDRSPKRSKGSNSITPINSTQTIEKNINKRDLANVTLADLFLLIESKSEDHSKKLDEMSTNIGSDITNFKEEINQKIDVSLQNINNKIDQVEKKAEQSLQVAMDSQKLCVNFMKQARLENCMDISGLKFNDDNTDLKSVVVSTIRSFKIKIEENDIKKVTLTEIKKPIPRKILTVIFDDVDTKLRVIREKSKIKENNGVFFNITLTPSNGYFMRKTKFLTKGTNLQTNFFDGAVHVKTPDGNSMTIQNEENLIQLKKLIDQQPTHIDNNNNHNNDNIPQPMDIPNQ